MYDNGKSTISDPFHHDESSMNRGLSSHGLNVMSSLCHEHEIIRKYEAHTSIAIPWWKRNPQNDKKRDLHILVGLYFSIFFGKYILRYYKQISNIYDFTGSKSDKTLACSTRRSPGKCPLDRCGCVPPRKVQWRLWIDPHTGFWWIFSVTTSLPACGYMRLILGRHVCNYVPPKNNKTNIDGRTVGHLEHIFSETSPNKNAIYKYMAHNHAQRWKIRLCGTCFPPHKTTSIPSRDVLSRGGH